MDDGARALPDNLPTKYAFAPLSDQTKTQLGLPIVAKSWAPNLKSNFLSTLGQSFQINGGFATKIFKKDFWRSNYCHL